MRQRRKERENGWMDGENEGWGDGAGGCLLLAGSFTFIQTGGIDGLTEKERLSR